jgi:uncharacterized protein (DUF433 family)
MKMVLAIRIGNSRVLLELVIHAFQRGETPEAIAQNFSSLLLDEVYAVIAYYLQHRAEVDTYLHEVETEGEQIRREIEASQPERAYLRAKLLKQLAEKEQKHGSSNHL